MCSYMHVFLYIFMPVRITEVHHLHTLYLSSSFFFLSFFISFYLSFSIFLYLFYFFLSFLLSFFLTFVLSYFRSFSLSVSYDLWQRCGEMKYAVENEMVKSHCVRMTAVLKASPGRLSSRKIMRCMRSFSASSSRVWIQPSHQPTITLSQQQPRQSYCQTSRYVQTKL
jgi:hypothetical protein